MSEFEIIDPHVHTYPNSKIGLQALQGMGYPGLTGIIPELIKNMKEGNVLKAIQVNMTPVREMADAALKKLPKNLTSEEKLAEEKKIIEKMKGRNLRRNIWTCDMADRNKELIAFVSLDPLCGSEEMIRDLLDKVKNRNVTGIKLHPGNGRFFPYDKRMWPVYEKAIELKLPIISHAGAFFTPDGVQYSQPKHFKEVLDAFPDLILVMAHLGIGYWEETRNLAKKYDTLIFDTSRAICSGKALGALKDRKAIELIRDIGVERVMWASDYPWGNPARDSQKLASMDFSNEEKIMLLAENAKNILTIKP